MSIDIVVLNYRYSLSILDVYMKEEDRMDNEKCAVILAGGKGTRLRPYTIVFPKPLVPIGEYPILEIIISQLASSGFKRVIIAVNHQADLIKAYFGDGSKFGVKIEYSLEEKPLSTMGPLLLMNNLPDNFLVMNGDILSDINYKEFLDAHINSQNLFTISAYKRKQDVDYGVLHVQDECLTGFEEKPILDYLVSMGIYAVSKDVLQYIPKDTFFGFDDLMRTLLNRGKEVHVKWHKGYWLDIGRPEDYQQAIDKFEQGKGQFLKELS